MDKVLARDNGGPNFVVNVSLDAVLPGLIKCDAINPLQDVDACGRLANLKGAAVHKVGWTHTIERCTVLRESAKHRFAVLFVTSG
ncbi:MAG TPA: hypothetical protein VGS27_10780 [Candidatus Sulfotelmatobacter sp.]|nr:hypothetical protein [Candidatus Sulfotelmatobacter sp.]